MTRAIKRLESCLTEDQTAIKLKEIKYTDSKFFVQAFPRAGSLRACIKVHFLGVYLARLRRALEDGDISPSFSSLTLMRLIDAAMFGSASERIAGKIA